ncbi:hypothetical protein KY385_00375 [Candidatus Parcubacteria bacterium]|nr:hypothetical protein [Candidatus Parcubacteria bacterium]
MGEEKNFELPAPMYATAPLEDSDPPEDSGAAPNPFGVRAEGEPPAAPPEIHPLPGHDGEAGDVYVTAVDYPLGPEDESSQGSGSTG